MDEFNDEKDRRNSFTIIDEDDILKEELMEKEQFKKAEIFENRYNLKKINNSSKFYYLDCDSQTFHQDRNNDENVLCVIQFELSSFELCFFEGKDFDFELTTPHSEEPFSKSSYEKKKEGLEILPEYFISGHETINLNKPKRKRNRYPLIYFITFHYDY